MECITEHRNLIFDVLNKVFGSVHRAELIAKTRSMDLEDLLQVGYIAIWRAQQNYKPSKGKFSTYAFLYIRGKILSEINKNNMITTPERVAMKQKPTPVLSIDRLVEEYEGEPEMLRSKEEHVESNMVTLIDFQRACERLNPKQKDVIYLYQKGYTSGDIGKMYGCTTHNIGYFIRSSREKLSKYYEGVR